MSGLEVISSIASIAQLAGNVYAISKTLYEVGNALSNAPSDIQDLARDLETFSEELRLLSTFLDQKKGYADQIHRLTAKIIGDCAKICVKIDRILQKLRNGRVWARVKWLYKEKEIKRLLARLRDLKLCLMGTLSFMNILKADAIMDTMNVPSQSLLENTGESMSAETIAQLEETRSQLSKVSIASEVRQGIRPQRNLETFSNWHARQGAAQGETFSRGDNSRSDPKETQGSNSIENAPQVGVLSKWYGSQPGHTISNQTPGQIPRFKTDEAPASSEGTGLPTMMSSGSSINATTQIPNISVESFHSARSQFAPSLEPGNEATMDSSASPVLANASLIPRITQSNIRELTPNINPHLALKIDMVSSAIKHFQMSQDEAEAWAATSIPNFHPPEVIISHSAGRKTSSQRLKIPPITTFLPPLSDSSLPPPPPPLLTPSVAGKSNEMKENSVYESDFRRRTIPNEIISRRTPYIDSASSKTPSPETQAMLASPGLPTHFTPRPPLTSIAGTRSQKNLDSYHDSDATSKPSIIPGTHPGLDKTVRSSPKPAKTQIMEPFYTPNSPRMTHVGHDIQNTLFVNEQTQQEDKPYDSWMDMEYPYFQNAAPQLYHPQQFVPLPPNPSQSNSISNDYNSISSPPVCARFRILRYNSFFVLTLI
jgi:hypothetical protein